MGGGESFTLEIWVRGESNGPGKGGIEVSSHPSGGVGVRIFFWNNPFWPSLRIFNLFQIALLQEIVVNAHS